MHYLRRAVTLPISDGWMTLIMLVLTAAFIFAPLVLVPLSAFLLVLCGINLGLRDHSVFHNPKYTPQQLQRIWTITILVLGLYFVGAVIFTYVAAPKLFTFSILMTWMRPVLSIWCFLIPLFFARIHLAKEYMRNEAR